MGGGEKISEAQERRKVAHGVHLPVGEKGSAAA